MATHRQTNRTEREENKAHLDMIKHLRNLPPGLRLLNTTAINVTSRQTTAPSQLRLLIACPRSGTALLMRVFEETPECVVASRLVLAGNETNNTTACIVAKPETVAAYQQTVREQSVNRLPRSDSTFSVLPPPFNYTAAKPIFLVRDPVRIFDSLKYHGWTNIESFFDSYQELFNSMDKHPVPPPLLVYEKLVRNPHVEIARLCDHWDIGFDASMLTFKRDFTEFTCNTEHEEHLRRVDIPADVFNTVSSSTQVRSDLPAHGTLSNQEIFDIEQQLGHLYLRCWKPEIRIIRAHLLRAKWFAFDLDDTLHEFRRASAAAIDAVFCAILSELPKTSQLNLADLKSSYANVLDLKTSSAFVDGKTSHEYREDRIRATLTSFPIEFSSKQMTTWVSLYETSLMQNLEPKCGVVGLFTTLKSLGKKIAIITEGPQDASERTVSQLGLTKFVDFLATTNGFGVSKTNGLFERVVETLAAGAAGEEFVMVGDSFERDIAPARDAGMYCVHYSEKENFDASGDVLRVNTLKKLELILGGKI